MVAFLGVKDYNTKCASGCGSAWLERRLREAEVASSNPATPIICKRQDLGVLAFSLYLNKKYDARRKRNHESAKAKHSSGALWGFGLIGQDLRVGRKAMLWGSTAFFISWKQFMDSDVCMKELKKLRRKDRRL